MANTASSSDIEKTFMGHPRGLYVLFFTEMWERMSYYGMRSLLVLYMVKYLFLQPDVGAQVMGFNAIKGSLEAVFGHLDIQPLSSQIYGLYTALVYFTPFFGGLLADRFLGQRKAVIVGGILMAIGHFLMAFESLFFIALMFLIIGNGAFKPNVSTQVGALYPAGDPRRDRAFNIFYMGINLGAFLSPLVCGTLGQMTTLGTTACTTNDQCGGQQCIEKVAAEGAQAAQSFCGTQHWHWGFAAAGVGMLIGLCLYLWGQRYLADDSVMKKAAGNATATAPAEPLTSAEWGKIGALVVLCALNIVFWAVYEQQGNTMQIWADSNVRWPVIFGWQIPSTWFQSFNPFMIFAFIPLINMLWARQAEKKTEPSSVSKMAIGAFILGLSFIVMIVAVQGMAKGEKASMLWLFFCTAMLTLGEIYLSPVGLSLVTKLAPVRLVSMLMGMWFLSSFAGNYLSGYIGTYYEKWSNETFFTVLTVMGIATGISIFVLKRPLKKFMGDQGDA
jgi:POT family proton-dependent oligopeptide transporter